MNCRVLIQYSCNNKVNSQYAEIFLNKKFRTTCKHTTIAYYRNSFNCWDSRVQAKIMNWRKSSFKQNDRNTSVTHLGSLNTLQSQTDIQSFCARTRKGSLHVLLKELNIYLTDKTFTTIINSVYYFQFHFKKILAQHKFFQTREICSQVMAVDLHSRKTKMASSKQKSAS